MGYQIEYRMDRMDYIRKNTKSDVITGFIFFILLVIGTVGIQLCNMGIQRLLLDSRAHLQAAADQFADDLQNGMDLKEAVLTFCTELAE